MMKVLVAYDGSKDAESAIDDLHSAGLPKTGSAQVISVAEVWLPPPGNAELEIENTSSSYVDELVDQRRDKAERAISEAELLASFAATRVRAALPDWNVTSLALSGSPGWEIVNEAKKSDADLIVVGAQGRSLLSRLVLGSISQRVLTEAHCSVRIGRGKIDLEPGPQRMVVGFDGLEGACGAVDLIVSRVWREGSEVRLICVTEPVLPSAIERFVTPGVRSLNEINVVEQVAIERSAAKAVDTLRAKGLSANLRTVPGNPKHVMPEEAERWSADCIFMGATALGNSFERFLIGSTSAAVAARADCSVEVVRAIVTPNLLIHRPLHSSGKVK